MAEEDTAADAALRRIAEERRDWDGRESRRRHHFNARIAIFLCILALVASAGAYVYARHASPKRQSKTAPSALTFDHRAGLGCASAPAWSPDGRLIAVLGTQQPCSVIARTPDDTQSLYFFDSATGKLGRILKLKPLLQPQFSSVQYYGGCHGFNLSLCYDHIAWSPDGQSLAVLLTMPESDPTVASDALVVVEPHGASIQVLKGGTFTQPTSSRHVEWALWDLQGRTVRYTEEPDAFNTASQLAWGQNGALTPSTNTQSSAVSPVGNPPGGSAVFSPWQPGSILLEGGPLLASSYWAWSPDGRYLATGLSTQIVMKDTSMTPTTGANSGYGIAAPRDEALTAVLSQARAQPVYGEAGYGVAWTPSGSNLAELRCSSVATQAILSIWNTQTGARVTSTPLALSQENTSCVNLPLDMAWSPDGQRLALVSPSSGGFSVVQPQLP